MNKQTEGASYRLAGVDIDLAKKLLDKVRTKIDRTRRPEVLAPVGGFGGLFQLDLSKYRQPVLVSSVDGVGTKLMVASMMDHYEGLGHDIVNHCVNDIIVQGAEPLYFLDYYAAGKLEDGKYRQVLGGIADACAAAGCALLGGETAEMPGMYGDDFDLVGAITGVVEKSRMITGEDVRPGQAIVGFASNGLHTNGYSLARHVLFEKCRYNARSELKELGGTIGEALLRPHICYWPVAREAQARNIALRALAHITGGGLVDNVPRVLPDNVDAVFRKRSIDLPPIFKLIREEGGIAEDEMYRAFNMGVGLAAIVDDNDVEALTTLAAAIGFKAFQCGEVVEGSGVVHID